MLDFDNWFFVLLANFLVLLYVLNIILFRPFLKIVKEREESTTGAIAASREMQEKKDKLMEEMKKEFAVAASKAREEFEAQRSEGLKVQRDRLHEAGEKAASELEKARAELKSAADKARDQLRGDVEKFSEEIVSKLVGV